MIRELSISNGQLLLSLDDRYQFCELYFPRIGHENLVPGRPWRFGLAAEGKLYWTDDRSWRIRTKYIKETLTGSVSLSNNQLQVVCYCREAVDVRRPIFVRRINVRNLLDYPRTIGILHLQDSRAAVGSPDPAIMADELGTGGLVVLSAGRYVLSDFWHAGRFAGTAVQGADAIERELVGVNGDHTETPDAAGSTSAGLVRIDRELAGFEEDELYLVMILARNGSELADHIEYIKRTGPATILDRAGSYWRLWVTGTNINFGNLPGPVVDLFNRSLLTVRAYQNRNGAVARAWVAPPSSGQDLHVSEIAPAALIAHCYDRAGLPEPARRFYRLVRRMLARSPWPRLERYTCQGEPVGTEHLAVDENTMGLSFAPAGSAVVLWALWRHYFRYRDLEYLRSMWEGLVTPLADGLCELFDSHTELPRPGLDLYRRGVGLDGFTLGAIYGGLTAGKNFAICFDDRQRVDRYGHIAEKIKRATERRLYDEQTGRFGSVLWLGDNDQLELDRRLDSSILGLVKFAMFSPTDERIVSTVNGICDRLWVNTPVGGLRRFEGETGGMADRPAVVPTLWLGQYLIARAEHVNELKQSLPIFEWTITNAGAAGMLPTSLDPATGRAQSGGPDLWAHAEFVVAVTDYLEKLEQLQICSGCGQSVYRMRRHWPMQVRLQDLLDKYDEQSTRVDRRIDNLVVFEHNGSEVTLAIDLRECIGCGVCTINCEKDILVMIDDKARVDLDRLAGCSLCMACEASCPVKAIKISSERRRQ